MKNLIKTLCAISLFAVACTKENTPGPNGTNGINGTNGTSDTSKTVVVPPVPVPPTTSATVLYSDWMIPGAVVPGPAGNTTGSTTGSTNTNGTLTPTTTQYFNVPASAITQEILDKGVVLAFCRLNGDNINTKSLITTTMISGFISIWDFVLSKGQIQFTQFSANPFGIPTISNINKFRYVIIPPTKHLRLSKTLKDMTYDEVCAMFNIPK